MPAEQTLGAGIPGADQAVRIEQKNRVLRQRRDERFEIPGQIR